jgi:Immunity protein 7
MLLKIPMIEYHVWLTLLSGSDDEILDSSSLSDIREAAANFGDPTKIDVSLINGMAMLRGCGAANHALPDIDELLKFCKKVVQLAPASYGLVYLWDDEASNSFEVWVIGNGDIRTEHDPFSLAQFSR